MQKTNDDLADNHDYDNHSDYVSPDDSSSSHSASIPGHMDESDNDSDAPKVTGGIRSAYPVQRADLTKTMDVYFFDTVSGDVRFNGMMTAVFENCFPKHQILLQYMCHQDTMLIMSSHLP